jgi:hypothetical protein
MARITVPLMTWANIAVTIDTDETDPEKIAELASENVKAYLCTQCADSGNDSLELGDDWQPVRTDGGPPHMTREDE